MRQLHSILFIEPDDSLDMYAYYLRESGFTVQTADTTDDGLRRASDADVIVTWIRVPGDEVELVRRLRNTDATRHTPVIVLTACGSEVEQWRALVAGCDMFLQKPCPPERLVNEIRWVLTHGRLALPQPARAHLDYRNRRAS